MPKLEFDIDNNKEYKIETIRDSAVYIKETERYLPSLYYLVSWKDYPKKKKHLETFLCNYASSKKNLYSIKISQKSK